MSLFGKPAHVVGQMVTVRNWFPTVLGVCNCKPDEPTPLLFVSTSHTECPECHKVYVVTGIKFELGSPHIIQIGLVVKE